MPAEEVVSVKGRAVVHAVFELGGRNAHTVAGLKVEDGTLKRGGEYRVVRKGDVVRCVSVVIDVAWAGQCQAVRYVVLCKCRVVGKGARYGTTRAGRCQ
jgi:hypothetical protein